MALTERNRNLRWVTDKQVTRMRNDTRTARRLAYYEYTRLDEIMRRGMIEGGGDIDVEDCAAPQVGLGNQAGTVARESRLL